MSHTITISDTIYSKAQSIAEANSQSVEDVIQKLLSESLDNPRLALPQDEQDELAALHYLSDATLFTIAREQMPSKRQETMQVLMNKNNFGTISAEEQSLLEQLVEDGQRLTLRKAEAMKVLIQRGHKVTFDILSQDNE